MNNTYNSVEPMASDYWNGTKYVRKAPWTLASQVQASVNGSYSNLQNRVGSILGITSSLSTTIVGYVLDAVAGRSIVVDYLGNNKITYENGKYYATYAGDGNTKQQIS